jgi:hypothetical protein
MIICECGCPFRKDSKKQHFKTAKHKEYVQNRLYIDIQRGLNIIKILDKHFGL